MKQVMKVEMFGRKLVVKHFPGTKYEYRVYEIIGIRNPYHLDSFESFQEAVEDIMYHLYSDPTP